MTKLKQIMKENKSYCKIYFVIFAHPFSERKSASKSENNEEAPKYIGPQIRNVGNPE